MRPSMHEEYVKLAERIRREGGDPHTRWRGVCPSGYVVAGRVYWNRTVSAVSQKYQPGLTIGTLGTASWTVVSVVYAVISARL